MNIVIKDNYTELASFAAEKIADYIKKNKDVLICLAAGDTMMGVFHELIQLDRQGKVKLSDAYYVCLDEWVGIGYETKGSCRQVLFDNFYTPANIPLDRISFFDGLNKDTVSECNKIADYILSHKGIGIAVLGVGLNGHVGFNEPYTKQNNVCITVALDRITKEISSKYFGKTTETEFGITISIDELMKSQEILLIANGENKAQIIYKTVNDMPSMAVPSTLLRTNKCFNLLLDRDAALLL